VQSKKEGVKSWTEWGGYDLPEGINKNKEGEGQRETGSKQN
jgi:hypothetical protein